MVPVTNCYDSRGYKVCERFEQARLASQALAVVDIVEPLVRVQWVWIIIRS